MVLSSRPLAWRGSNRCKYVHTGTCTCTGVCVCACPYIRTCIQYACVCIHICIYIYIYIYIHMCNNIYIYIYIYVHIRPSAGFAGPAGCNRGSFRSLRCKQMYYCVVLNYIFYVYKFKYIICYVRVLLCIVTRFASSGLENRSHGVLTKQKLQ